MKDCIFCKIAKGDLTSYSVFEDDKVIAFLDINPINSGHCLVVPKNHQSVLWQLPDDDYQHAMSVAKKLALKIQQELKPPRVGEVVEGFAVDHAHIHILPISQGFENELSKPKLATPSPEELEQMAARLKML